MLSPVIERGAAGLAFQMRVSGEERVVADQMAGETDQIAAKGKRAVVREDENYGSDTIIGYDQSVISPSHVLNYINTNITY